MLDVDIINKDKVIVEVSLVAAEDSHDKSNEFSC